MTQRKAEGTEFHDPEPERVESTLSRFEPRLMYNEFYKLRRSPFEITPDPFFLFPTGKHREALAALYYGVRQRKGFVVLTGEVGTGKTLLIRCLLQLLKKTNVAFSYVFNSRLSNLEFLQYVASDFGLAASGKDKGEVLRILNQYLLARHQRNLTTVVVVDEAHHLSTENLEEIRLLTNLETAEEKLLQILLVGQSELNEKLDSSELRQLKQRVALRSHLTPLDCEDTRGYIQSRLERAGASPDARDVFPQEAIARIFYHSRGIPRLINTISDNAMLSAFARELINVPAGIIDEVAGELGLREEEKVSYLIEGDKGLSEKPDTGVVNVQVSLPDLGSINSVNEALLTLNTLLLIRDRLLSGRE